MASTRFASLRDRLVALIVLAALPTLGLVLFLYSAERRNCRSASISAGRRPGTGVTPRSASRGVSSGRTSSASARRAGSW